MRWSKALQQAYITVGALRCARPLTAATKSAALQNATVVTLRPCGSTGRERQPALTALPRPMSMMPAARIKAPSSGIGYEVPHVFSMAIIAGAISSVIADTSRHSRETFCSP